MLNCIISILMPTPTIYKVLFRVTTSAIDALGIIAGHETKQTTEKNNNQSAA